MGSIFPLQLAPVDDFFRRDDHSGYPMTFVTELGFDGVVDRQAFEKAFDTALQRHPIFRALIKPARRNRLCWVDGQGQRPPIDWADERKPMTCPDDGHIDLGREVGMRIWVRQGCHRTRMLLQYHHAATDGNGAHRFIGDLLAAYDHEFNSDSREIPFDDIDPRELRNRRHRMAQVGVNGSVMDMVRVGVRQTIDLYANRICRLSKPTGCDSSVEKVFPGHLTHSFSADESKQLTASAKREGGLLNDLLISELFHTVIEWNQRHHGSLRGLIRILIPSDMRDKHDFEMPAANMTSFAYVSRKARQCRDARALLTGIQREMLAIRHQRRAARFIDGVMLMQRIPWAFNLLLKWRKCLSTSVLSNVGDPTRRFRARLPREGGKVVSGNLRLTDWAGVSPLRPNTRAAVTVNTYGRALSVTVSCDPNWFAPSDTNEFLESYIARLKTHLE